MSSEPPVIFDDDNPEWTEEDFARAKRGQDIPEHIRAAFPRTRGRPAGSGTSDRQQVTMRLPKAVIEHFKRGGPGWQTRAIAVLEREVARSEA